MSDQSPVNQKAIQAALEDDDFIPIVGVPKKEDYLSSGSTLLDLCSSSNIYGCFLKGHFHWFVGSSSSGKSMITMNTLAEACKNQYWSEYELIHNNIEDGVLMDVSKFFGATLARKIRAPEYHAKTKEPIFSQTIDHLYFHLDQRLSLVEKGKAPPFIEVVDSLEAMSSMAERKKFSQNAKIAMKKTRVKDDDDDDDEPDQDTASEAGQMKGDYGDGKAKINSRYLRDIVFRLRATGCTLIMISQERDNMTPAHKWDTRGKVAGGRALRFYATNQIWTTQGPDIKKEVNGTKRKIGVWAKIDMMKNRITGREWQVKVPILNEIGVDDIGSLVQFMIDEKCWEGGDLTVDAPDFKFKGSREKFIEMIETKNLEFDLKCIALDTWREIEKKLKLNRKPKYH